MSDPCLQVLVVEDDDGLRGSIREYLRWAGFVVDVAADGLAGLDRVLASPYDVVVSDIRLPVMSGLNLAKRIGHLVEPPPVILITAYPDWSTQAEGEAAGAVAVLAKPLKLRRLAEAIEKAAEGRIRPDDDWQG